MPQSEINSFQKVLQQFIARSPYKHKYFEHAVIQIWKDVFPPYINKRTSKIFVKKGVLYVKILSSALKHELQLTKDRLLSNIQEELKTHSFPAEKLESIHFL